MSHTPGPWFPFDDEIVSERGDVHVAQVALCDGTDPTEWQANMRLIAAAPDLLSACKAILVLDRAIDLFAGNEEASAQIHAAIAKAEGQA